MKSADLQTLITLHAAAVNFGPVQALRSVDLQLHRGESLMLVGANAVSYTHLDVYKRQLRRRA